MVASVAGDVSFPFSRRGEKTNKPIWSKQKLGKSEERVGRIDFAPSPWCCHLFTNQSGLSIPLCQECVSVLRNHTCRCSYAISVSAKIWVCACLGFQLLKGAQIFWAIQICLDKLYAPQPRSTNTVPLRPRSVLLEFATRKSPFILWANCRYGSGLSFRSCFGEYL